MPAVPPSPRSAESRAPFADKASHCVVTPRLRRRTPSFATIAYAMAAAMAGALDGSFGSITDSTGNRQMASSGKMRGRYEVPGKIVPVPTPGYVPARDDRFYATWAKSRL